MDIIQVSGLEIVKCLPLYGKRKIQTFSLYNIKETFSIIIMIQVKIFTNIKQIKSFRIFKNLANKNIPRYQDIFELWDAIKTDKNI